MEQNPQHAIITISNTPHNDEPKPIQHRSQKRKKGATHVFRLALFMMRGGSKKSSVLPIDDGSKNIWRKLVGSMRPLHLQSNQSPRSYSLPNDRSLQITLPPPSPSETEFTAEEGSYSPSPPSSRYASAVGLNELVQSDEDNEKIESKQHGDGDGNGDEMIDAKAEEFIAQFYQEMRLQRLDSVDRRYEERNQRLKEKGHGYYVCVTKNMFEYGNGDDQRQRD